MRSRVLVLAVIVVGSLTAAAPSPRAAGVVEAGADAQNITPYTFVPRERADRLHEATTFTGDLQDAGGASSNPDGLAAPTLFDILPDQIPEQRSCNAPVPFTGQVTQTGVWGEPYTDLNGNHRYDIGEPFVDDPQNTLADHSSAAKYDGIYLAGFGSDSIPIGALDPVSVRTVLIRSPMDGGGTETFAWVTLDLVGWLSDRIDDVKLALAHRYNITDIDHIMLGTTHVHSAPDMIGLWGAPDVSYGLRDGKYPLYERYLVRKVAQSICRARATLAPAAFSFGTITPAAGDFPTYRRGDTLGAPSGAADGLGISGLQTRNSCRTPWAFDDELRVMRIMDARKLDAGVPVTSKDATIATVGNFGVHVESLEGEYPYMSSDFAHGARALLEDVVGGVAMHTPGAQGAVEIVGDSCSGPGRQGTRVRFDGVDYGEPGGRNVQYGPARTYAIGRVLGSGALTALGGAAVERPASIDFRARDVHVQVTNGLLAVLGLTGNIDSTGEINGTPTVRHRSIGTDIKTTVFAFRIGSASFVTSPGELFPELYFGVEGTNRFTASSTYTPTPAYVQCSLDTMSRGSAAQPYRPYEPSIRDAQRAAYGATSNWLIGYTPDLLGYIVPGYDFLIYGAPVVSGVGQPLLGIAAEQDLEVEVPDPCAAVQVSTDIAPAARYGRHYHEIVSASSMLAPALTCETVEMLGGTDAVGANEACAQWSAWKDLPGGLHDPLDHMDPDRAAERLFAGDTQGLFVRRY